jgi:hypothetical protein
MEARKCPPIQSLARRVKSSDGAAISLLLGQLTGTAFLQYKVERLYRSDSVLRASLVITGFTTGR